MSAIGIELKVMMRGVFCAAIVVPLSFESAGLRRRAERGHVSQRPRAVHLAVDTSVVNAFWECMCE